jgi:hypothetical protein
MTVARSARDHLTRPQLSFGVIRQQTRREDNGIRASMLSRTAGLCAECSPPRRRMREAGGARVPRLHAIGDGLGHPGRECLDSRAAVMHRTFGGVRGILAFSHVICQ